MTIPLKDIIVITNIRSDILSVFIIKCIANSFLFILVFILKLCKFTVEANETVLDALNP